MGCPSGERKALRGIPRETHRRSDQGHLDGTFQGGPHLENVGLFDTHCHLCDRLFRDDLDSVLDSARRSGVTHFLVPGIDLGSSIAAAKLSRTVAGVFAAAGMHPGGSPDGGSEGIERIPDLLLEPGVVAVGETGLDFHRMRAPEERQRDLFRRHIDLAEAFDLTLVVHSRGAEAEVLKMLDRGVTVPVVMHCYTGPDEAALEAAERGFYTGFAGPLTYGGNQRLRDLAGALPRERLLIETDAPWLSPEPVRGRERNQPSNLVYTAETLSDVMGGDLLETAGVLDRNSMKAFRLGPYRRTDLVYSMYGNIYMNVTGRCSNHCRFCIRDRTDGLEGYYLRHSGEPEEERLRAILKHLPPGSGRELVFCGYGEPAMRPRLVGELAGSASAKGYRVRLNTNGTCLGWLSREEAASLACAFDTVSVSLNASCEEEYGRICRPENPEAWADLIEFIDLARSLVPVRLTAVRYPGIDIRSVRKLAFEMGLPLRER